MSGVGLIRWGEGWVLLKDTVQKHSRCISMNSVKKSHNVQCEKQVQKDIDNIAFL